LNAVTSPQFVAYVERKLKENDVAKIVPDLDLLAEVYIGMKRGQRLKKEAAELFDDIEDCKPPKNLGHRIREMLKMSPSIRWDAAVKAIVDAEAAADGGAP
jgi:hypothetical protein